MGPLIEVSLALMTHRLALGDAELQSFVLTLREGYKRYVQNRDGTVNACFCLFILCESLGHINLTTTSYSGPWTCQF